MILDEKKRATKQGKLFLRFINQYDLTAINMLEFTKSPLETYVGLDGSLTIDYTLVLSALINPSDAKATFI